MLQTAEEVVLEAQYAFFQKGSHWHVGDGADAGVAGDDLGGIGVDGLEVETDLLLGAETVDLIIEVEDDVGPGIPAEPFERSLVHLGAGVLAGHHCELCIFGLKALELLFKRLDGEVVLGHKVGHCGYQSADVGVLLHCPRVVGGGHGLAHCIDCLDVAVALAEGVGRDHHNGGLFRLGPAYELAGEQQRCDCK